MAGRCDRLQRGPRLLQQHGPGRGEGDAAGRALQQHTPSLASIPRMALDSGGWAIPSRGAARVKLRSSATAQGWWWHVGWSYRPYVG